MREEQRKEGRVTAVKSGVDQWDTAKRRQDGGEK